MITSLISPKIALGFVNSQISKKVNAKVKRFEIIYNKKADEMTIKVYHPEDTRVIEARYEDDKLLLALRLQIDTKAKNSEAIDAFIIEYNKEGNCYVTIYEKNNNQKEVNKYEI